VDGLGLKAVEQDRGLGLTAVPVNIRQYLHTIFGGKNPPKLEDFSESDLAAIRRAVEYQIAQTGKTQGEIGYGDYRQDRSIAVEDPHAGFLEMLYRSFTDPAYRMETTLGMAQYKVNDKGEIEVSDQYDFNAPRGRAEQYVDKKGLALGLLDAYSNAGGMGVANMLGNLYGRAEGEGASYSLNLGRR
jgi:hypothetical protein